MALNTGTADALATAIVTALGLTGTQATQALVHWKAVCETLYTKLKTDIDITIGATTIVTSGNASTQSGPPSPITIHPG